eukprot:Partr_v1_DN24280_c0_g1_i1_m36988 putative MAF-like protein
MQLPLILGSSSKFRQRVLKEHGFHFTTANPDIDEKAVLAKGSIGPRELSKPEELVMAICEAKAAALLTKIKEPSLLVTCDQVIHYHGQIREKPTSEQECRQYLKSYETSPAVTVSGVMITSTQTGKSVKGVDVAKQYFKAIPDEVVDQLLKQGDIMYCAGGFMIDHPLIHPYLLKREGDEDSIIGMPMRLLKDLLK